MAERQEQEIDYDKQDPRSASTAEMEGRLMDDEVREKLESIADRGGRDVEWAVKTYKERLAEFKSRRKEDVADDEVKMWAISSVQADIQENNRASGEVETIPILSLGHSGVRPMGGSDVLVAAGIINPQVGGVVNDRTTPDPAGVAIFLCDEEVGADLGNLREKFEPLATLEGKFTRRAAPNLDEKGRGPVYLCESTGETSVEEADLDGLPSTRDEKRKLINEQYITDTDAFTLDTFEEHITRKNKNGYPVAYGGDIKRFSGHVVEATKDHDRDYGLYVLVDDSVSDTSKLEETRLDTGDQGQKIGLRVWLPPEQVKYGKQSVVEVYGILVENRDGDIQMSGYGAVPIVEFELDDDADRTGSSSQADSDKVTKESIN